MSHALKNPMQNPHTIRLWQDWWARRFESVKEFWETEMPRKPMQTKGGKRPGKPSGKGGKKGGRRRGGR